MESKSVIFLGCLIGLFFISFVLQVCGTFSPNWINEKNGTSNCFRGVIYNKGCPAEMEGRRIFFSKQGYFEQFVINLNVMFHICRSW